MITLKGNLHLIEAILSGNFILFWSKFLTGPDVKNKI